MQSMTDEGCATAAISARRSVPAFMIVCDVGDRRPSSVAHLRATFSRDRSLIGCGRRMHTTSNYFPQALEGRSSRLVISPFSTKLP